MTASEVNRYARAVSTAWKERAEEAEDKLAILTDKYLDLFNVNETLSKRLDQMIGTLMAIEETCRERVDVAIKERADVR